MASRSGTKKPRMRRGLKERKAQSARDVLCDSAMANDNDVLHGNVRLAVLRHGQTVRCRVLLRRDAVHAGDDAQGHEGGQDEGGGLGGGLGHGGLLVSGGWVRKAFRDPMCELSELRNASQTGLRRVAAALARTADFADEP